MADDTTIILEDENVIIEVTDTETIVIQYTEAIVITGADNHNDFPDLQGGAADDYQHLTTTELSKLTATESGATADQTGAEIKVAYEGELNTNSYTDIEKTKLSALTVDPDHNDIANIQGGNATERYHLTAIQEAGLTGGVNTTVHFHDSDRNRANHTGTQIASTISDFDTEVSNNTDVAANTSARHTHTNKTILDSTSASYTTTEETKLAGIESGATGDLNGAEIKVLYEFETNTNAFTDSLLSKLNSSEINSTGDQNGGEIKILYEAELDTNAFTDALLSKLAAIESGATGDLTGPEIKILYEGELDTNAYSDAEKIKLAGTESAATADQTGTEIKIAYEGEPNTNALTDVLLTKLNGVDTGATDDQTPTEILTALLGVDGPTSLLDTDFLDGQHGAYYLDYANFTNLPTTISGYGITDGLTTADKGVVNGVASLDSSGLVPSTQLPSYVDDVEEYASLGGFPAPGETGKIYIALDTNKTYRWTGSTYVYITSGAVDSVNGQTGVVVLTTTEVPEGTNEYYTEAKVSANTDVSLNTANRHSHANMAILNNATASFTTTQETQLAGLGTASVEDTGTSGDTVPKNNTANIFDQIQQVTTGIKIGGSAADNLLDNYDSNLNWTPVFTVDTPGDLNIVYGVQVGRARIIGNRCDFNLRLTMTTFTYTTATGELHVSLPATSEGTLNNTSILSCTVTEWIAPAGYSNPVAQVVSGSSVIDLKRQPNNGGGLASLDISEIPPTPTSATIVVHIAGSFEV